MYVKNKYVKLYVMYVLALSDYKQHAAAAGYKPAPQLGRQTAIYHLGHIWRIFSL